MIVDKSFTITLSREDVNEAIINFINSKFVLSNVSDIKVVFNLKRDATLSDNEVIKNAVVHITENEIPKGSIKR